MSNFDKLLWIRGKGQNGKPMLVGIAGNTMYWNAGSTHCNWEPEKYEIVREFPYIDDSSIGAAEDELLRAYAPQPQPPVARLGFISPEGHFYPCGYCCHRNLEQILGQILYDNNYPYLDRRGWIVLLGGALIAVRDCNLVTSEAKSTLRQIVEAFEVAEAENPNINWLPLLLANPENYDDHLWWTSPTETMSHDMTYAQYLRRCFESYFGEDNMPDTLVVPPDEFTGRISRRKDAHSGD